MSKKKKYPGSIYKQKDNNRLYIKFKSVRHSTGLPDTKENRKICEELLMLMWKADHGIPVMGIDEYMNKKRSDKKPTFLEAFSEFEKERYALLNQKTKTAYESAFKYIIIKKDFLKQEVNEDNIRNALVEFQNTKYNLKDSSRRTHLTNFRVFHNWICKRYKIPYNDTLGFAPRATIKPVQTYTEEEYQKLISYWENKDREYSLMIRFMLLTGFRISETLLLRWDQVKEKYIEVPNKINKNQTETFPLFPQLNELLEEIRSLKSGTDKLFRWGVNSASSLRGYLDTSFKECGIDKKGRAFHVFRKTFNSNLIDADVNPAVAMELMRHKDIQTTIDHYTKVSENKRTEALKTLTKI